MPLKYQAKLPSSNPTLSLAETEKVHVTMCSLIHWKTFMD
jgi:hypothetical protein